MKAETVRIKEKTGLPEALRADAGASEAGWRVVKFSLGMHLADVAKRIDKTLADARLVQQDQAVIQELTWWPMQTYQASARLDRVEKTVFSFYDGLLYKVGVSYDSTSTRGLTAADMTKAFSAEYGVASPPVAKAASTDNASYTNAPEAIASWHGAQHYVTLVRSTLSNEFQLVLSLKEKSSQAETAVAMAGCEESPSLDCRHPFAKLFRALQDRRQL